MEKEIQLLEINLISAQGLQPPSSSTLRRRLQTYAIAWVDPAFKLRTRLDPAGGENPTWNDKFLFRVTPEFLLGDTSAVSIEIYAAGFLSDPLLGTVRFLLSSCISRGAAAPALAALQVRRPSGRFHGVLNIAAAIVTGLHLAGSSPAVCLRDLVEKSRRRKKDKGSEKSSGGESPASSISSSSSSSTAVSSTALKEWNFGEGEEKAGKGGAISDGRGLLCGLVKVHFRPYDHNLRFLAGSQHQENKEN